MENSFENLKKRLLSELEDGRLIGAGDRVLVAFSGGADSVALLLLLNALKEKLEIDVCAAHLNHGIRGDEADRDERFCAELCRKNGIPFKVGHADVPSESKITGEGIEECARRLRYAFLENASQELLCNKIATAHHADDNVETVLMHLIRGCGLNGLSGIPEKRGNIVRPLLCFRKNELLCALSDIGQDHVYDSTNSEDDASRNLLRHTVLPQIYALNPNADGAFLRMCRAVSEDNAYLEAEADAIPLDADRRTLSAIPFPVLSRYIRRKYALVMGSGVMLDNSAVRLICNALTSVKSSNDNASDTLGTVRYTVAGNVTARISRHGVEFIKPSNDTESVAETELFEGENIMSQNGNKILITCDKKVADDWQNIYKLSTRVSVNSDRIYKDGRIALRARAVRAGDSYRYGGHTKNVRKQLIDRKVPSETRRTLPCVCLGDEIVWVPMLSASDSIRPQGKEKTAYIIYVP